MRQDAADENADGLGLVEVIVAMLLLAVLALAVLPALISATSASATNKSLVAANNFAIAELAPIKAAFPTSPTSTQKCTDLTAMARTGDVDKSGSGLLADVTVASCIGPGTGTVKVIVYRSGSKTSPLVTLTTKVVVGG